MRRLALMVLFSATLIHADKPKPNAADFPITVHVISSHSRFLSSRESQLAYYQLADTVINGQTVELQAFSKRCARSGRLPRQDLALGTRSQERLEYLRLVPGL